MTQDQIDKLRERKLLVFDKPHYVKIEATHGCNRRCEFCAATINCAKIHRMSLELFRKIIDDLDDSTKRIDFLLHGEPALNPDLDKFCAYARAKLPKVQLAMLSNTDVFTRMHKSLDYLIRMFDAGLNWVHADFYEPKAKQMFVDLARARRQDFVDRNIKFYSYYGDNVNIFSYHGAKKKGVIVCDETRGFNVPGFCTRDFHTCGGDLPLSYISTFVPISAFPMHSDCTDPLKYMPIGSHGEVIMCCRDWARSINLGNVSERSVVDIWQSDEYHKIRWLLKCKRRDMIAACYLCNAKSFRGALYPYWGPRREETAEKLRDDVLELTTVQYQLKRNLQELGLSQFLGRVGKDVEE